MSDNPLPSLRRSPTRRLYLIGAIFLVVALLIALIGITSRSKHEHKLEEGVKSKHITVQVITPEYGPSIQPLILPGNVRANIEAPIYARVAGYLKIWHTDIGAHVKKGQLLGEIDTPELDQQIVRERANLLVAQSNLDLANITSKRWQNLVVSNSVSRQESDEKSADAKAKNDFLNSVRAQLNNLLAQQSFNHITAPFDGVITERNTDIGKLINPGSNNGQSLFQIADSRQLRIYVDVPQNYSADIKKGMTAELHFPEHPSQVFPATLVSTSQAIHESSRTLTAQLQMQNTDEEILPGTYAEVHFSLPSKGNVFRLPASTLLFRKEGLQVATVTTDNHVDLKFITLGRDLGSAVEVTSGISSKDRVIDSPSDSIAQGSVVRIKSAENVPVIVDSSEPP
ncbi:efflux RND transporter periplasmic adaptor subunit [Solimicrobium silvestre]|uniref:Efflux transporter, RND family, MFP subunit n=1 Tax=Solimicrobium silvestre TaxID=2099400 RepID=A0A2S9GZU7_9BURK|nr:efflux RND transporter periplasmic adaptor subunit [Solimicrobium silvestre]PRC93251.1 Efflux transporter, RND family, MFP subunit [Solimicrobium silvestre]